MKIWVLLVAAVLVWACTSRPQIPQAPNQQSPGVEAAAGETPEPGTEPEPAPATGQSPTSEPASEPPSAPGGSFVVSEEVYNKTFEEVEEFIRNLNEIIHSRDYPRWLTYLSDEYIRRKSDEEYLQDQSEMPLLKKSNIHLSGLQDYFEYVVAPSRSQAAIEEIEFIDENRVKVISSIRGTRGILYLLVRQNGSWKIGVWD